MQSSSTFANWLAGVRVLDFTAVLAGPHLTRVLAQAGAEVIKVEPPGRGDSTRALPYRYTGGQSGYFNQQNLGKRSIAVDLSTDRGRELILRLAAVSHVVVENYRPGVTRSLGVDYERIRRVRPNIVYTSISGWGQTGPYALLTGEVRSTTALSATIAPDHANRVPRTERTSFADMNASLHAVAAIGAGLYHVRRTGQSCYVDIALLEALMTVNTLELAEALQAPGLGLDGQEARTGGDHARVASGVFPCADETWLYVRALRPVAWAGLAGALGLPEAYRGLNVAARRGEAAAVYARLASFCAERDAATAIGALTDAGASAVRVPTVQDVLNGGRMHTAGLVQAVEDPFTESVFVPAGIFGSRRFGSEQERRAPLLGEHTRPVLEALLHLPANEIDALAADGVVQVA